MLLPDHEIRDLCVFSKMSLIDPYHDEQLAPSSYDVRLASDIRYIDTRHFRPVDLREQAEDRTIKATCDEGFVLMPGRFVLGSTCEVLSIPPTLAGRVEGKSSLARLGLQIHSAGFLDPGYHGDVTLEIVNLGETPIILWPDVLIAQIEFVRLSSECERPYEGKYQNSRGATASRWGAAQTALAQG